MVSLAGASAAYPGYQTARQADNQIEAGDIANQNAKLEQQGNEALGRTIMAFQASLPGAQPMQPPGMPPGIRPGMGAGQPQMQPPMPGQPSQPMQGPQSQGFTPPDQPLVPRPVPTQSFTQQPMGGQPQPPAGAPPAAMGALPGGAGGVEALRGKLDVPTLMGAISKANPGAPPAVIAAAMNKALPLLNAQAQMDWKQMMIADRSRRTDLAGERVDIAGEEANRKKDQGNRRLDQGDQRIGIQEQDVGSKVERRGAQTQQGAERIDIAKGREARLAAQGQIRQDQRWQQLDQQAQALAERIRSSGDRSQISQWRAIVDAQHKRAMEIIQSGRNGITGQMDPKEREALVKEENAFYESQIKQMREHSGNSTGRPPVAETGGSPGQPKDTSRVPAGGAVPGSAPAPAASRPQAVNPKTGEKVEFDGQNWVPVGGPAAAAAPPG
jgi:hypothetical protein